MRTLPTFFDESADLADKKVPEKPATSTTSKKPAKGSSKQAAASSSQAGNQQLNGS